LVGQWSFHLNRVELGAAYEVGAELLRLTQQQGDVAAEVMGRRVIGTSLLHLGKLDPARANLEQALTRHDPVRHRSLAFGFSHLDPRVAGRSWLSWGLFLLGFTEQARLRSAEALDHARELTHVTTMAFGLHLIGSLCHFCGDSEAVLVRPRS
jgi:hypothetical protein